MKRFNKKAVTFVLLLALILPLLSGVLTFHSHADGWVCGNCGEWFEETPDLCFNCYTGECCADICPYCLACTLCAIELGYHCPECNESCVDPEFGDFPHCVDCNRCENCVTLYETNEGPKCEKCLELDIEEGFIMCPNCGVNAIGHELADEMPEGELDFEVGDCGAHCPECYEAHVCPECSECTLCKGVDLCETCGICEECAINNGYHCPDCGECYGEAGQCPYEGEHCTHCCEDVCENCGECTLATGDEYCGSCHLCADCQEHCEVCGECFEENGRCDENGDHCAECCDREGWICGSCRRCTQALGIGFCDICGLCEECCKENSEYYGLDKCVLDESADIENVDPALHDENHHILHYQSSSEECHDVYCVYPGCDYYLSDCTPHEFKWKTIEKEGVGKEGKRKGVCIYCGHEREETVPALEPLEYCFVEQPKDMEALKDKQYISFYVHIAVKGDENTSTKHAGVAAFPVIDDDPLPETWAELRKNIYSYNIISEVKETAPGLYKAYILGHRSDAALTYGGKFTDYSAQGKKLTWRLALYDRRGNGNFRVTYSEPFVIDWDAKHTKHSFVYVCGTYDPKSTLHWIFDGSQNPGFFDGTYHWSECSVCGAVTGIYSPHRYKLAGEDGTCYYVTKHYVCADCGHQFDRKLAERSDKYHVWSAGYQHTDGHHYKVCTLCGASSKYEAHDFEKQILVKNCEKTVIAYSCKVCGLVHLEHDSGAGHKYTNDGDFNGWYGDTTRHWKTCTVCGHIREEKHKYAGGACSVCGIDFPQMAIVGDTCVHGGELHLELKDEIYSGDMAKFKAGQYSVTWIDEDTDKTVGLGKVYELGPEDEGHMFRAEVSIIGGGEYYAYMISPIKTEYITVKGYPATCAAEGMKDHSVCASCGKKFINGKEVKDVTIPKTNNHKYDNSCDKICNVCGFERNITHTWSKDYSFTENGHCHECTVCGAISGLEAHELTVTVLTEWSCKHDGLVNKKCFCGYDEDAVIPADEHKFSRVDAIPATCITPGVLEHYECEGCKQPAKDKDGKEIIGINKLKTELDPNNHVGGDMCYNEAEHYIVCVCGEHIEKGPHTFGEDGRCTVCHYKKNTNVKTGATALTPHEKVPATCVSTGTKAYYTDGGGKIYLSKAGMIEVKEEDLIIPIAPDNHVGGEYEHSDAEHWIHCACGAKLDTAEHKFDDKGVCSVCLYKKEAAGSDLTTNDGETTDANMSTSSSALRIFLIILAIFIALCGAAAVVIIIIVLNKKKKEEKT